jgi:hypothetical protein
MKFEAMLWAGILISPIVWFINLEANFALAPLACSGSSRLPLYLVSAISLALVVLAGSISLSRWQLPERNAAGELTPARPRRRAMAVAGLGLSGLFFLVIVAQAIPNLMLAGCE